MGLEKNCHECHAVLNEKNAFCPNCGAKQEESTAPVKRQEKQPDQKYCPQCGALMHKSALACPSCGARQGSGGTKNRITAGLLAFFLGGFGIHHFYLGNTVRGIIYLIFCWTFIPALIAFIEGILFLVQSDEKFDEKYNQ